MYLLCLSVLGAGDSAAIMTKPIRQSDFNLFVPATKYIFNIMGILATPPKATPPRNKALLRAYYPLVSLNKALLGPYLLGGVALGGAARIPLIIIISFQRATTMTMAQDH